ncbi:sodium-dependent bicarbonate transport family permease [Undibacterium sp. LX40W]|uniref:Sodium-dependent bicarbonate transport family permease n=1 Tax=Undibacterium nitidum TaxID=2762298 RepID=A0A923HMM3_9BURK|nr:MULTISPECIES: sodium-dependent bicarbonate transport family permease [Undibacterium]MBC3879860.1 sodium-dependent bicarbonate transport family permease [Undibacterium nitidum]MBC3891404.1 sodium-dependent bicarbonate transport family permease [Undibacterium sp. LX40W]
MHGLLDPTILFFIFGLLAGLSKSNLEIPPAISRFLSLYLLMALGLKGGFALAKSGMNESILVSLACAVGLAVAIPLISFWLLRRIISAFDAAAVAATYGSVSAVTFITATQILESTQVSFGGHMAAAMALMESPAIILAVLFANKVRQDQQTQKQSNNVKLSSLLHESLTDGAQLLLLGSLLIGVLSGESGQAMMKPFSVDLFKGLLAFFLLDMGLTAARNLPGLKGQSILVFIYALLAPMVHASFAFVLAKFFGLGLGDTVLLMVLAASASYIAVPAVVRYAIPEANPSLYIGMSLGITFPFNIVIGIPTYLKIAQTYL